MVLFLFKVAVLNALVFNVEIKSGTYDFYTGWWRRKFNPSEHKYFILNDEVKKKETNTTAAKIVTNITPYMLVVLVTRLTHPEIIKKRNDDNDNISKKSRGETSG